MINSKPGSNLTASRPPRSVGLKKRRDKYSATNIPSEIVIEIIDDCNLSCNCCTNASKSSNRISLRTVTKILNQAADLGISAVRFTGGEPLLHPGLTDMFALARERKFYILLNTNATLLTSNLINSLSRSVDNVLVSLQGFNPSSDQKLTGSKTSFAQKIANIVHLRQQIKTVRIGTVITRVVLQHLYSYAKLIRHLNVNSWELFRPMTGLNIPLTRITLKEYRDLTTRAFALRRSGVPITLANALPFCLMPDTRLASMVMLGAASDDGHSRLIWDVRGFFKPSYFICKDLGSNIHRAWTHPFLKKLQSLSYLPKRCQDCHYLAKCKGGSRFLAHTTYNTYFAVDPLIEHALPSLPSTNPR